MTILIPALLMFLAPQTSSRSADTSDLYQACKAYVRVNDHENNHEDVYLAGYCPGYIKGYLAGLALFGGDSTICASQTTLATAARVYTAFLDHNPKLFDQPPEVGFALSMLDAYPCPTKRNP